MSFTGDNKRRPSYATRDASRMSTTTTHSAVSVSTASPSSTASNSPQSETSPRGRFPSWLSRGSTASTARIPFLSGGPAKDNSLSVSVPQDDELMNLDINAALFPGGHANTFSPAAFKNLEMNATGLLSKFQEAYQQRVVECHELRADREAQSEEKDEVETRVHHLKMQLEEMARKAAEREATLQSILQELAQERRMRMDEESARMKKGSQSAPSTVSEDLQVEEDQLKKDRRKSAATFKTDLSVDTDTDSMDEASIFSRSRSPTIATSMCSDMSPVSTPMPCQKPIILEPPRASRSSSAQMSTLQKLFRGTSNDRDDYASASTSSCANCQGQDASMAWDTVNLLKDENRGLKTRVEELETAVDSALDAANGLVLDLVVR